MSFFIGEFIYALDDKKRINIPAKFKKEISEESKGKFIVSYYEEDNCLSIYPYDVFMTKIVSFLNKLSETDKDHRAYKSMVGENSIEVAVDKQGRIGIPANFLDKACITKEVKIIGAFDKIEIWDPKIREDYKIKYGGVEAKAKLEQKIADKLESGK